ncbi:MAG: transcriptional repressor [Planctomycetes bacterium]|nr:transcriptional repressor [Planctomycetota bacterium]
MQRSTRQRRAIQEVLETSGRPLSPKEIVELAASQGMPLSLTTVYRSVKGLLEQGELTSVEVPGQPARYEAPGLAHHHHFHCEGCDRVFDIPGCPKGIHQLAPKGFVSTHHELTLHGRCPACA